MSRQFSGWSAADGPETTRQRSRGRAPSIAFVRSDHARTNVDADRVKLGGRAWRLGLGRAVAGLWNGVKLLDVGAHGELVLAFGAGVHALRLEHLDRAGPDDRP